LSLGSSRLWWRRRSAHRCAARVSCGSVRDTRARTQAQISRSLEARLALADEELRAVRAARDAAVAEKERATEARYAPRAPARWTHHRLRADQSHVSGARRATQECTARSVEADARGGGDGGRFLSSLARGTCARAAPRHGAASHRCFAHYFTPRPCQAHGHTPVIRAVLDAYGKVLQQRAECARVRMRSGARARGFCNIPPGSRTGAPVVCARAQLTMHRDVLWFYVYHVSLIAHVRSARLRAGGYCRAGPCLMPLLPCRTRIVNLTLRCYRT
jgi:hypothetical protein